MIALNSSNHLTAQSRTRSHRSTLLIIVAAIIGSLLFALIYLPLNQNENLTGSGISHFHILVAATGADISLCKLFLSVFANNYPTPVLINWKDENDLGKAKYIEKLEGTKEYLSSIQSSGDNDKDIVLIVSGYDAMIQLGPDVLLENYFETIAMLDQQFQADYERPDIRHTILFGADKHCWPGPLTSPSCWMVPKSPLDVATYGPYTASRLSTGSSHWSHPRWLDSGIVIGPVDDLLLMYKDLIAHVYDGPVEGVDHPDSEQAHVDALFVMQEQTRLSNRPEVLADRSSKIQTLNLGVDHRSQVIFNEKNELHIGLDYHSTLFQPLMWQEPFLMWARPNAMKAFTGASSDEQRLQSFFDQPLPKALSRTAHPYSSLNITELHTKTWSDVNLLHNVATKSVPAIIHFTLHELRDPWWEKLWFQDHARDFRLARMEEGRKDEKLISSHRIDGRLWYGGQHVKPLLDSSAAPDIGLPGAGVWKAEGDWISWNHTCGFYEQWLFA